MTPDNVLGVVLLIFWSLILIISAKYMIFLLRADNRGEGGTFALMALLRPDRNQDRYRRRLLILLGILGASMLYGGAMITPAISVLSAVVGLQVAAPHLDRYVIPITGAILFALFAVQRHGTAKVGAIFGPLTLVWFAVLAGRKRHGMVVWRDRLFVRMAANSQDATAYYQIPSEQAMKVGLQIGI